MSATLDLVQELQKRATAGDKNAASYVSKYTLMKAFLAKSYYPYIQANCQFFTDHGEAHIDGVIWAASQLLQRAISNEDLVTSFDIYLLLTAIIWHDAGMVSQRRGHEIAVRKLLDGVAELAFEDITEKRLVEEIIAAHTGRGTIQRLRQEERFRHFNVYPRVLASILRFGDEISEDSSRISQALLKRGGVPAEHLIYWHYAACVKASHPDPFRERVILTIEIDQSEAVQEFLLPQGTPNPPIKRTLIEYVVERIEKVVLERAYCATHFSRHASIQAIEVRLSLINGTSRIAGYDQTFEFGELEYPEIKICQKFFDDNPKWKPEQIQRQA
jgi:hypothetical protein